MVARLSEGLQWIGLKNIETPGETQPRDGIDKGWASDLSRFRKEGSQFPPATVFQLPDGRLILAAGHHRHWSLLNDNEPDIWSDVVNGSFDEAVVFAAGSNRSNGVKPMQPKDVTKALRMLLSIERWWFKGDQTLSAHVGCSHTKARTVRLAFATENGLKLPDTVESSDGKIYKRVRRNSTRTHEPLISKRSDCATYFSTYRNRQYQGKTEKEVRDKINSAIKEESEIALSLKAGQVGQLLLKAGFRRLKWNPAFPAFFGFTGHGIVAVPCDFQKGVSLVVSHGNLRLLLASIGRADGNRQRDRHATRSVILCYRKYGPAAAIELFEEVGVEFMTPHELVDSLGPGKIQSEAS